MTDLSRSSTQTVRKLLQAADQMAEGLCELCDHIYELTDGVVKQPLAAANALSSETAEWLREYENRSYDETDGHA